MQPLRVTAVLREDPSPLELIQGRRRPLLWHAAGAMTLLGILGLLVTRAGIAVTPDSVQYLSTAHQIARGAGVSTGVTSLAVDAATIPLGPWPPLYPGLIAACLRAGSSILAAPHFLAVLLLVLAVIPLMSLARNAGGVGTARAVVWVHALLYYPIFLTAFAWSEPLYIFLSLSCLALLARAFSRGEDAQWEYAVAGGFAGLAMLTRYIGVTLVAAGLLSIVLVQAHYGLRRLARSFLYFLLPAALPNALWLWRNHERSGHFFGEDRPAAFFKWDEIIHSTTQALTIDWTAPILHLDARWAVVVGSAGVLGALCLVGALVARLGTVRVLSEESHPTGVRLLLAVNISIYVFAIIAISERIGFDPLNTRYLSPVYPLILILVAGGLGGILASDRRRRRSPFLARVVAVGVALWLVPQVASTAFLVGRAGREERTLTRPYWTSTLWDDASWNGDRGLRRVAELGPGSGLVISNLWDFVGIRTGLSTKPLPEATAPEFPDRLREFPGALVAIHGGRRTHLATAADLRAAIARSGGFEDLGDTGEWSFFRVLPGGTP